MHSSPRHLRRALLAVPVALAIAAAGCGSDDDGSSTTASGGDAGSVDVVATTTVLGDVARAVGGDAVSVDQLLQPNSDPHDYEPRPDDVIATAKAQLVLASGEGLDDWAADVLQESGGDATLVDVGATLPTLRENAEDAHDHAEDDHAHEGEAARDDHAHEDEGQAARDDHAHEDEGARDDHAHEDEAARDDHAHEDEAARDDHAHEGEAARDDHAHEDEGDHAHEDEAAAEETGHEGHDHGPIDPHWWHDPTNVVAAAETVRDALTRANPDGRDVYARNAAAYVRQVEALDAGIRRCLATIPADERKIVTDHDALGYFADRYDLEVVGAVIPSLSTQAQPSAGDVAELARVLRREGVRAVFPESGSNRKLPEAVARETGATAEYQLYGDTLGAEGSDAATYLGMEAHNADAIVRGLTGGERGCDIAGL